MIDLIVHRPYVFAFLAGFLFLALRRWGIIRTLVWLVIGYGVALASEASSIRNGFPYGLYAYHYAHLGNDPLVFGVPVWDSLSYPFMIYAGYATATWHHPTWPKWAIALGGAFYTMLLDVIIDPIAHMGALWFLGDIYDYAHPGQYFGVPLSNFAGWFLVAWVVIQLNQWVWVNGGTMLRGVYPRAKRRAQNHTHRCRPEDAQQPQDLSSTLDLLFFAGIALFGTAISFMVKAWALAVCSTLLLTLMGVIITKDRYDTRLAHH